MPCLIYDKNCSGSKSYINLAEEFIGQNNNSEPIGRCMNAAKKGLGRGLSALFGDIENKSNLNEIQKNKLPISDLQRNQYQPRTIFDEDKLAELTSSIKENGVVQPIAVRPNKYEPGKFEIIVEKEDG